VNRSCRSPTRRPKNRHRSSRRRRGHGISSSSSTSRSSSSSLRRWDVEDVHRFKRSSHGTSSRSRRTSGAGVAYGAGSRSLRKDDSTATRFDDVHGSLDNASERKVRRGVLPRLKVGRYDGSTSLETFLARFNNCCDYYNWNASQKLCNLRARLDGGAGQVLLDAGKQSSVDEIISLLKNRFGTQNQDEWYRAELKAK